MEHDTQLLSRPPQVGGSSFYLAMRIMPPLHRRAMYAIYSFCRAVDDIADSNLGIEERLDGLERWRRLIDDLFAGADDAWLDMRLSIDAFDLRRDDFMAIIDGMEMDVFGVASAPTWATLDLYCDRVASAVGRLSVRVFEMEESEGGALAQNLGRALQLTNILRDLDEDADNNRLYLPAEALDSANIIQREPHTVLAAPGIDKACSNVVARAQHHFAAAREVMAFKTEGSVRTPRLMCEAYASVLDRLVARGWRAPRARVRVNRARLFWILMCNAIA